MVPRQGRAAARALVVNSGNANAFTGKSGRAGLRLTAKRSPPSRSAAKPGR
jgi:N-acetylglutamate synthase/N-acetylornithine aminotransferase